MSEENFLRYRLQVVQGMPDGPLKTAILTAIYARAENLLETYDAAGNQPKGPDNPFKLKSRLAS